VCLRLAFSPDGATLVAAGADGVIHLWDLKSGQASATLRGHRCAICVLQFAPDGRTLASASGDGLVKLWDFEGGKPLERQCTLGHRGPVTSLAFSHDGSVLASIGVIDGIKIWDVATHRLREEVAGTHMIINGIFAPTDRAMIVLERRRIAELSRLGAGFDRTILGGYPHSYCGDFSVDGRFVAAACVDDGVRVWDVCRGSCRNSSGGTPGSTSFFTCFSPPGRSF
jgi:WD40 repeat protein